MQGIHVVIFYGVGWNCDCGVAHQICNCFLYPIMVVLLCDTWRHVSDRRGCHWVACRRIGSERISRWYNCNQDGGCSAAERQCRLDGLYGIQKKKKKSAAENPEEKSEVKKRSVKPKKWAAVEVSCLQRAT